MMNRRLAFLLLPFLATTSFGQNYGVDTTRTLVLREVNVRPERIVQREDTLAYPVAAFKTLQDRSIADVLRRMPGIEVSGNGLISYEGKPINKFYIEGMDLMGGKYAQASENLQASKVKEVQVLPNHQPIRSLRGAQFSEQAALNIVLKDNEKNTWARTADIGLGMGKEMLHDGRLMAMMFSNRHQALSMYKTCNTGKDIVHEVASLASFFMEKQEMDGLPHNITVSAPDLDEERTNFNNSHTVAMNELVRTRRGNDLRVQADWTLNKQGNELYSETQYTDLGGVLLSEETSVTAIESQLKADLKYSINKDNIYLNNRLHGYIDFDRSFGTTVLDGNMTRQSVKPRKRFVTQDFEAMKTLKNGNILNLASLTTCSDLPGQLLTVLGEKQRLNLSGIESRNTVSLLRRLNALTLKCEAGLSFRSQKMVAGCGDATSHETYSQQDFFLVPSVNLEHQSLKLSASLKTNLLMASSLGHPRLTLQPRVLVKYSINGTSSLMTIYSRTETPNPLTRLFSTPVFTSYRTMNCYSGRFEPSGTHTTTISYNYRQPVRGNFLTIEGMWLSRTNNILYRSTLAGNVYLRTPTDQRYTTNSYTLRAHAAKALYWAKTTLSLTATHNRNDYSLLVNSPSPTGEAHSDAVTSWQMQNTALTFKLSMTPARVFSCELRSQLDLSRQRQKDSSPHGEVQGEALTCFNHSLDLYLFPHRNWELALKNELYHSNDQSVNEGTEKVSLRAPKA